MGSPGYSRIAMLSVPWAITLVTLSLFLIGTDESVLIPVCLFYTAIIPGHASLLLLSGRWKLDHWERGIMMMVVGAVLSFLIYAIIILFTPLTWVEATCLVLLPLSALILLVAQYFGRGRPSNLVEGVLLRTIGEFKGLAPRQRSIIILSILAIAAILIASFAIALIPRSEGFTEFYVLNEQGKASEYPTNITLGDKAHIIIGIVNHEDRTVNYTVEIWLVNYTLINMAVNVTQMFYVDSFSVVLEHKGYDLNIPWSPQYEKLIEIEPAVTGDFQLMIMLFKDTTQPIPGPIPPDHLTDFSKTEVSWRIVMCVNQEINYLMLYLEVYG